MIDLRSVEVFFWVVELGGFRRAAERLHTSQPAVSARIAGLEAALGARLLERGQRRRVSLTAAGIVMLGYAERLVALQGELRGAFDRDGVQGGMRGTVRLGVSETIVHTWLPALLRGLHAAYPGLEVDVSVDVSAKLRAALLAGEVEVALLLGPVAAAGVRDIALCEHALCWVAGSGLALGAEPLGMEALAAVPVVTYARGTAPYRAVRAAFAGAAAPRVFANASLSSLVRMVADGIGVGVVARDAVTGELARGVLREVATTVPLEPLRFTASWREGPAGVLAATVARMAQVVARERAP